MNATKPCPVCGTPNRPDARFCGKCGAAYPTAAPVIENAKPCPTCGAANRPDARFCGKCGAAFAPPAMSAAATVEWQRPAAEIATRIAARELSTVSDGVVVVGEGSHAFILEDGKISADYGPGRHSLPKLRGGLFGLGRQRQVEVILVPDAPVSLDFDLTGLWTKDPLRLAARVRMALRIADPARFVRTLLRDADAYTTADLRGLLFDEVSDAAQVYLADHSMADLDQNLAQRTSEFAVDIRQRLGPTFQQYGLELTQIQTFSLRHPRRDALREQEEDLFLGPAELHNQQRFFDLYSAQQAHELAKEEAQVAHFEQRARIWERMRRAVQQNRISETASEQELKRFLADVEKQDLLRGDELAQLRQSLNWQGEDRNRARAQTLALADLKAEYDCKAADLSRRFEHDQNRLRGELALAEQETLGRLDIERRKVEKQLDLEALQADQRRRNRQRDELDARERALADAQNRIEIQMRAARSAVDRRRLEIELERLEDDNDLLTAEKAQAMQLRVQEEALRIKREDALKRELAALEQEERRWKLKMEEQRAAREHELARLDRLAGLSAEALIAVADDAERARLLADLKRTETLKGFTEEQILALAAEKSPAVVEAIKARYQAAGEGQVKATEAAMWQKLAEEHAQSRAREEQRSQDFLDRQDRAAREAAERQERLAAEALRQLGDVAKTASQRKDDGPTVIVTPGATGGAVYGGGQAAPAGVGGGEVQVCPKCHIKAPIGEKFCANCGHKFFED